jgi:hypothetical protein
LRFDRSRQSSPLLPTLLAALALVMEPLCGVTRVLGRGVHRTLTFRQVKDEYPDYALVQGKTMDAQLVNGQFLETYKEDPNQIIIKDFDISGTPVDICVSRPPNTTKINWITLDPNLDKVKMPSARQSTYDLFKKLLMTKYGTTNEQRTPIDTGIRTKAIWTFPSTSIELIWSEGSYADGYVLVSYTTIRTNPM